MQRYFIDQMIQFGQTIPLDGEVHHHIKNVMRMTTNDTIILCDDYNHCFYAKIEDISKTSTLVAITEELQTTEYHHHVDIAQALIRRERFELMLQKSTELGVRNIIPTIMKNNVVRVEENKAQSKIERWNKITVEASEQSHRSSKAVVTSVLRLENLPFEEYDSVFVCYEKETVKNNLRRALQSKPSSILIVIGPEGGFTPSEIKLLQSKSNVEIISLGQRILRSETASLMVLSTILYEYEMSD